MPTQQRSSRTFTISFPPELAEQVERVAADEHRTISELFREVFRKYRNARAAAAFEELSAMANRDGVPDYTEADIQRFVHEIRAKRQATKA